MRDGKLWFDLIQSAGVLSAHWSKIGAVPTDDDSGDDDVRETETYPTDPTQDFAAC
ncbi:MAG: hypothetical protein L0H64_12330 [Pseudonocardia sp.]|nr:hypothetical protein [Pseudonocardia sp.]